MWKKIGVIAVWVLATVGTASITLAAVSQVGGRVTEQASGPIDSVEIAAARAATASAGDASATAPADVPATTSTIVWVDTSIVPDVVSTTPVTSTASATTAPAATTQTTAAATVTTEPTATTVVSKQETTTLIGGTITVLHSGSSVTLVSAVPNSGFWAEVEASGPTRVEVEFESESHDSYYEAVVLNGALSIQTREEAED